MTTALPTVREAEAPPRSARRTWALPALAALLLGVALSSCLVGSVHITLTEVGSILLREAGLESARSADERSAQVLLAIRLPRVLLGGIVGAGLGLSGACMQGVFRNALVDPGLLGVSAGASLGAVAMIVVGAKLTLGLSPTLAYHGYHALMMHILGFALLEQRTGLDSDNVADAAAEFLAQFEDQEFPHLIEHMHQHVHAPAAQNDFEFVLDVILDGLDRLR